MTQEDYTQEGDSNIPKGYTLGCVILIWVVGAFALFALFKWGTVGS